MKHYSNRRNFLKAGLLLSAYGLLWGCRQPDVARKNKRNESVLIVGAGIAGLAAAQGLLAEGFQVTVLEGRDRIGGRIWTDRSLAVPVDLGASWIHGVRRNPISILAREFDIETNPSNFNELYLSQADGTPMDGVDGVALFLDFEELIDEVTHVAEQLDGDVSTQEGIRLALAELNGSLTTLDQQALNWLLVSQFELDWAADLSDTSLLYQADSEVFKGEDHVFPGGYDQIVTALAEDVDIQLGQQVHQVVYDTAGVRIETADTVFEADRAVITAPLGVLKAGTISFSPALPASKQAAINRLEMGLLNKIVLKFPDQFWLTNAHFFGYLSETRGQFPVFMNQAHHLDAPVLTAFVAGSVAHSMESQSNDAITADAMQVLRTMFGASTPDPTDVLVTRWAADPFSRGAYAYIPVGATPQDYQTLAEPVSQRLFFAGEATNHQYPATVHGAFLSGIREAERIAEL